LKIFQEDFARKHCYIRISSTVPPVDNGLAAALAKAARDVREEKDVSKEAVAVALGQSVDKVRYFEKGEAFGALSELYAAYSTATGVSLIDLLDEAKANLKKNG
jgi:predicted phosphoribosyltransferase